MSVSQVLDLAADHIAEVGLWQSGNPKSPRGSSCTIIAVGLFVADDLEQLAVLREVAGYLGVPGPLFARGIWEWNDAPGRTQLEVVTMLRAAAIIAGAREVPVAVFEVTR